jgi:hypothetical protein
MLSISTSSIIEVVFAVIVLPLILMCSGWVYWFCWTSELVLLVRLYQWVQQRLGVICANTNGKNGIYFFYFSCDLVPKFPTIIIYNSSKPFYNSKPKSLLPIKFSTIKPCTGFLFFFSFLSRELKRVSNCC